MAPSWEHIGTSSLASAFSTYVKLGCVVISTNITVDARGKKVFDKTPWKTAASSFDENKNSLMVVCGRSNLCCIDVDYVQGTEAGGMEAWEYFEKEAGGPFDTFTVMTGNGGKHIFFTQEGIDGAPWNGSFARCFKIDGKPVDIDVRGVGGMVYAAPSRYTDGAGNIRCYTVLNGSAPMKMPIELVKLLTKHTDNAATKAAARETAPSAGRTPGAPSTAGAAAAEIGGASAAGAAAGTGREPTIEEVFNANNYLAYISENAGQEVAVDTAVWANHAVFIRLAYAACNLSQGSKSSVGLYKPLMRLNAKYTELRGGEREDADALWQSTDRNRNDCPGLPFIAHVYSEYLRKLKPLQEQSAPSGTELAVGGAGGGGRPGGQSVTVYSPLKRLIRDVHAQLDLPVSDAGVHKLISSVKAYTVYDFGHYLSDVLLGKYRYGNDSSQSAQGAGAYFLDGTRYVFKSLVANLNCYAQESAVSVLQTMLDLTEPSSPGYASRTPISDDQRSSISAILSKVKGGAQGYDALWSQVSKLIQSDQYYIDRGLPTPTEFFDKLDDNPYLIGFNNGVFDMKQYQFHPKGSVPPDVFISYSTKYDYIGDVHGEPKDDEQRAMMEEVERETYGKFFPDEVTRKHAQAFSGFCLTSGNLKRLALFVGQAGDNGKTGFAGMLLKVTFGDYAGVMDPAVLTDDRDEADKANPSLSINRKRKIVVVNEGHNKKLLNASRTKTLTGGDMVTTRKLYGQPVESSFNPKIIWVGNFPPKVNGDDGALLKRMMPFEFTAKFGDHDDDPVNGLWRAADSTVMMEKYKRWAPYHMMLLIRYSRTMKELPKPEGGIMDRMLENTPARTVADFLTGYRHTNDDDKATITSENTIGISQLRDAYKNQCGLNIDQNAFMDELERLGVKVKRTATRSNGVNHNKLAWLQCIPDTEAPARSWGAARADSADEAP